MDIAGVQGGFIELRNGPTVPAAALLLVLRLEDRQIGFEPVGDKLRVVNRADPQRPPELTPEEIASVKTWKLHLMAVAAYVVDNGRRLEAQSRPKKEKP